MNWSISTAAPERTETRSGREASPNFRSISASMPLSPSSISSHSPAGSRRPPSWYSWHASVDTVNPGGTDRPTLAISAKFAPFPPSCTRGANHASHHIGPDI